MDSFTQSVLEKTAKAKALAEAIIPNLDQLCIGPWNIKEYEREIEMTDGAVTFGIQVGGYRQKGRVIFSQHLPRDKYAGIDYLGRDARESRVSSITVSQLQDPKRMAGEIHRRLLPNLREVTGLVNAGIARAKAADERARKVEKQLADVVGGKCFSEYGDNQYKPAPFGVYAPGIDVRSIRVNPNDSGEPSVTIEIGYSISPDQAEGVLRALVIAKSKE